MTKDHLASIFSLTLEIRANVCNMNDAPQVGTCALVIVLLIRDKIYAESKIYWKEKIAHINRCDF